MIISGYQLLSLRIANLQELWLVIKVICGWYLLMMVIISNSYQKFIDGHLIRHDDVINVVINYVYLWWWSWYGYYYDDFVDMVIND